MWSFLPLAEPDCGWDRLLDLNLHSHTVSPCQILSASSRWSFFQFFTSTSSLQKLTKGVGNPPLNLSFLNIYIRTVSIKKDTAIWWWISSGCFLFWAEIGSIQGCLKKTSQRHPPSWNITKVQWQLSTARLLWLDKNREPTLPATFDVTRFYPRPLKVEQTFSNEKHLSETFNLWIGF